MRFHCPRCDSIETIMPPVDSSWTIQCGACRKTFQWSDDLVVPYCYTCLSEEVAFVLKTPIGFVHACADHSDGLADFWLLPMIQFSAASRNHAREYDGSPSGPSSGPGGISAKKKAAGK